MCAGLILSNQHNGKCAYIYKVFISAYAPEILIVAVTVFDEFLKWTTKTDQTLFCVVDI